MESQERQGGPGVDILTSEYIVTSSKYDYVVSSKILNVD